MKFPFRFRPSHRTRPTRLLLAVEALESRRLLSANLLKDINPIVADANPRDTTDVNGVAFFTADDSVHGRELWESDGTAAGTVLVRDIQAGGLGSDPRDLRNVNGTLYFSADDGISGRELWQSDGTEAGTQRVADLNPGGDGSDPANLTAADGMLYFTAFTPDTGRELWRSDGTAAGTQLVADIHPGGDNAFFPFLDPYLTYAGGTVFTVADDGIHGREVWAILPDARVARRASDPRSLFRQNPDRPTDEPPAPSRRETHQPRAHDTPHSFPTADGHSAPSHSGYCPPATPDARNRGEVLDAMGLDLDYLPRWAIAH